MSGRAIAVPGAASRWSTSRTPRPQRRRSPGRDPLFRDAEGIAHVVEPKDYPRYHLPQPVDNQAMGDLVLAARKAMCSAWMPRASTCVVANPTRPPAPWVPLDRAEDERHLRGRGAGIKSGTRVPTIENIDVAPTVARLLDVRLENIPGRVLKGILAGSRSQLEGDERIEKRRATK